MALHLHCADRTDLVGIDYGDLSKAYFCYGGHESIRSGSF